VRLPRDYRPQQVYAVTQRGNGGQWVYRDPEDFEYALALMRKYAQMHKGRLGVSGAMPLRRLGEFVRKLW
jgi:hypothetical protein